LCRKIGIVHLLHLVKENIERRKNREQREDFVKWYGQHKGDFERLSAMLEDDLSRKTLENVIKYRMTWKSKYLKGYISEPQYFQKDIFQSVEDEVFIDGGAYVGDTIENYIKMYSGVYRHIYAWEPDGINVRQMKKNLGKYKNISIIQAGMWKEKSELAFSQNGGADSKVEEEGVVRIKVDSIDNVCSKEKVTFIKMDIEGSEQAALQGAKMVIQRDKPRLAICIYHSKEDLIEIPFMIKEMVPEYKLYIRHHSDTYAETVLYATL
jgi:FkbM family methyltransferase